MGVGAAALAWGSAVAPLLLAVLLAGSEGAWSLSPAPDSPSHVALAALPWIALAGLPPAASPRPVSAAVALALFLPPVALAAQLDLAGGVPARLVATSSLGAGLAVALLFGAARRASGTLYAVAWAGLLAGPPLLLRAVGSLDPARGSLASAAGWSPLEQVLRVALGGADGGSLGWLTAVGGAVLLFAVASAGGVADDGGPPLEDTEALR